MASTISISHDKLARLVGTPKCPALIDIRTDDDFAADPRLIPGSLRRSPEAPGLLAASLGLSRIHADDLEQLEAGVPLYDAFYRWCRDATGETHNWPTNRPGA